MWNSERIAEEHAMAKEFGLRNLKEVWKAKSELRRIRGNVREVLAGRKAEKTGKEIIERLSKYNIAPKDATLDSLLLIKPSSFLERRLETIVLRKGLAKTAKQARQLITHGFISVNGKRTMSPSYFVNAYEENMVSYYKQIKLEQGQQADSKLMQQHAEEPNGGSAVQPDAAEAKEEKGGE
jgi:small subunit ribosomal protein S4